MDGNVVGNLNGNGKFPVESSTSGSVKRSRTPNNGIQVASCLVDGCTSDLSKCRDYHRRHRVCELHSKTPKVTVRGQEQRFCQQCSRFHSLEEFDDGKRSCRKRLDGHNRRRRKPQPEPLPMTPARFVAEHPGPGFSSGWGGPIKAENDHYVSFKLDGRNGSSGETLSEQGLGQTQFSLLQGPKSTLYGYSASELNLNSNLPSENAVNNNNNNQKAFSYRARSLLSSTLPQIHPNAIPQHMSMDGSEIASHGHNITNCEGMMFSIGSDGSASSGASHKLFTWE